MIIRSLKGSVKVGVGQDLLEEKEREKEREKIEGRESLLVNCCCKTK